jgi:hypothetical protein
MARHVNVAIKSEAQRMLVQRVVHATSDVPDAKLRGAKVLRILLERLADEVLPTDDSLARARLRGVIAMRELLSGDGGALTGSEVGELLGISRQAVDKRRKAGQLLVVELPRRGLLYPAWQFVEAGMLPGFLEVLAALRAHDPWAQARFFVTRSDRLARRRPLDVLRKGQIEPVLRAAEGFGEQGAA